MLFVLFLMCAEDKHYGKVFVPGREKMPSFCPELSILRSRVKLGLSSDSAANTLHTHVEGEIEPSEVFSANAINAVDCCS